MTYIAQIVIQLGLLLYVYPVGKNLYEAMGVLEGARCGRGRFPSWSVGCH